MDQAEMNLALASLLSEVTSGMESLTADVNSLKANIDEFVGALPTRLQALDEKLPADIAGNIADMEQNVLKQLDTLNDPISGLAATLRALGERSQQVLECDLDLAPLAEVESKVIGVRREAAEALEFVVDQIVVAIGSMHNLVEDTKQQVLDSVTRMDGFLDEAHSKLSETLDEQIVAEVDTFTDEINGRWNAAMEQVKTRLSRQIEQARKVLADEVDEILDFVVEAIRDGLAETRQRLVAGDAEGAEKREALDQALAILKPAMAEVEKALEAFAKLAGTVGIRL